MIVDMPREAKVGGGVWHEYILLLKKKKKKLPVTCRRCQFNFQVELGCPTKSRSPPTPCHTGSGQLEALAVRRSPNQSHWHYTVSDLKYLRPPTPSGAAGPGGQSSPLPGPGPAVECGTQAFTLPVSLWCHAVPNSASHLELQLLSTPPSTRTRTGNGEWRSLWVPWRIRRGPCSGNFIGGWHNWKSHISQ